MTVEHAYDPGWVDINEAADAYLPVWGWREGEMAAWRYCPVCGSMLIASIDALVQEPRCITCDRPYTACPCACTINHARDNRERGSP